MNSEYRTTILRSVAKPSKKKELAGQRPDAHVGPALNGQRQKVPPCGAPGAARPRHGQARVGGLLRNHTSKNTCSAFACKLYENTNFIDFRAFCHRMRPTNFHKLTQPRRHHMPLGCLTDLQVLLIPFELRTYNSMEVKQLPKSQRPAF